ncbi:MAG TPA: sigma-70 family RNA polymerase sigma factor [Polyangia bacterium]|nr:sigma-70 family RNA polymerase sigma factor [Polyangia bacterium]
MPRHAAVAANMDRSPPVSTPSLGDPHRLEQMFKAHRGVVWRLLRCKGLPPDVAADATQEVFLVAVQRLPDIAIGKERAFLIGTALRVAQAAQRTKARWKVEEEVDVLDEREPAIDDRKSALDMIGKILERVDPPLVEVFVLYEIAEFSSFEIAELLGIPRGTVASRLRFAREAFREAARRVELTMRREQGQS